MTLVQSCLKICNAIESTIIALFYFLERFIDLAYDLKKMDISIFIIYL